MKKVNQPIFIVSVLSLYAFILIYGVSIINPCYTDWLIEGDLGQHYLGWKAFRNSPWMFPIGMTDHLAYPTKTSIIFTDSIPLCSVFFKLISPILPSEFQFFGIWGVCCFILQGMLACKIISRFSCNNFVTILLSLLMLLMPAMIFRMFIHSALAAQWLILYGLDIFFSLNEYKVNKQIFLHFLILGGLSAFVHQYYVAMNGIIVAGICFYVFLGGAKVYQRFNRIHSYLPGGCSNSRLVIGRFFFWDAARQGRTWDI